MDAKQNYIILGVETKRGHLILFWLALSFFGGYSAVGIYNILRVYFNVSFEIYFTVAVILYFVIVICLMPVVTGATETLTFSDDYVCHYQIRGYLNKCNEIFRILMSRKKIPDIEVKTDDIDKINLSYLRYLGPRGFIGYRIKLTFLLKDGTSFYLFPISNAGQMENGDYEKALSLMENHGIEIVDKYYLRSYLSKSSNAFQKYIADFERNKKL